MPNKNLAQTGTPTNHFIFDPWNSASSGHQRSESNPGIAWQRTREAKLAQQLRTGDYSINSFAYNGSQRVYEKGEWEWDWGGDAKGGRGGAGRSMGTGGGKAGVQDSKQRDIKSMMRVQKAGDTSLASTLEGKGKGVMVTKNESATSTSLAPASATMPTPTYAYISDSTFGAFGGGDTILAKSKPVPEQPQTKSGNSNDNGAESTILRGTTIYINGQTAPLISDHKLKGLLVAHGAALSLSLTRRVTHVIIGKPNSGPGRGGAGGGLAAGKIQKEIQRGGWRGMRIVGVKWALESIKSGIRLPETRFAINLSSQRSVLGFM
ncbi:hypothetical protein BDW62DRAFT_201090 [Aspergillus aurantiobrunneus]